MPMPSEDTRPLPLGYVVVAEHKRSKERRLYANSPGLRTMEQAAAIARHENENGIGRDFWTYTVEPVGGPTLKSVAAMLEEEAERRVAEYCASGEEFDPDADNAEAREIAGFDVSVAWLRSRTTERPAE